MIYRTRTYLAADWTYDINAVKQLKKWNNSNFWDLSFGAAHELSECRSNNTNNCNIKKNCSKNLDYSKSFILIIDKNTKSLRVGYCFYCKAYNTCQYTYKTNKFFVEYKCDYALRNNLPIIVLYNSMKVDTSKCIDSVIDVAKTHTRMVTNNNMWDYQSVYEAFKKLS